MSSRMLSESDGPEPNRFGQNINNGMTLRRWQGRLWELIREAVESGLVRPRCPHSAVGES
jgi:hypothetical protein